MTGPAARARVRRLALDVTRAQDGRRLDHFLSECLPARLGVAVSKSSVRRLIMAGAVRVNGRPSRRPGLPLPAGSRIEAYVAAEHLRTRDDVAFVLTRERVLYQDEWLIAVDKPPGLPTVATIDPRRPHLVGLVERYLARDAVKPYVGVHQRLDRDTSGVVLFTRDPAANPGLARAFEAHAVVKTYRALTRRRARPPALQWRVSAPVDGAAAVTDFARLEVFEGGLLLEARPRTGRKHQIRVHLSGQGMPILGDERYGGQAARGRGRPVPRLMLHASSLRLAHPMTGAELTIESPDPEDFQDVRAELSSRRTAPSDR